MTTFRIENPTSQYFRGVLSSAPSGAQNGWLYINSSDRKLYIYYGGVWQEMMELQYRSGEPIGLLLAITYS